MFSVVIRERGGSAQVHTFDKTEVSIGRIQGNDIVLPKGNISKRHARLVHRDDDFVVVDLRSTNGTYVNGHKVSSPMVVSEDDKLYLGDFVLQVARGAVDPASLGADVAHPGADAPAVAPSSERAGAGQSAVVDSGVTRGIEPLVTSAAEDHNEDDFGILADETALEHISPYEETVDASAAGWAADVAQPAYESAPVVAPSPSASAPASPAAEPAVTLGASFGATPTVGHLEAAPHASVSLEGLGPVERYQATLALLHDRAAQTVFADRNVDHFDFETEWHALEHAVFSLVERARSAGEVPLDCDSASLTTDLLYEFIALGPVEHLLADDTATEVFVDGFDRISVRRAGQLVLEPSRRFSTAASFEAVVQRLIRTRVSGETDTPILTGQLDDGTRFTISQPPASAQGPLLRLVKLPAEVSALADWAAEGRATDAQVDALRLVLADAGANVAIASRSEAAAAALLATLLREMSSSRVALLESASAPAVVSPGAQVVRYRYDNYDALAAASASGADRIVVSGGDAPLLGSLIILGATQKGGLVFSMRASGAEDLPLRLRAAQDPGISKEAALTLAAAALDYAIFVAGDSQGRASISSICEVRPDSLTGIALHEV